MSIATDQFIFSPRGTLVRVASYPVNEADEPAAFYELEGLDRYFITKDKTTFKGCFLSSLRRERGVQFTPMSFLGNTRAIQVFGETYTKATLRGVCFLNGEGASTNTMLLRLEQFFAENNIQHQDKPLALTENEKVRKVYLVGLDIGDVDPEFLTVPFVFILLIDPQDDDLEPENIKTELFKPCFSSLYTSLHIDEEPVQVEGEAAEDDAGGSEAGSTAPVTEAQDKALQPSPATHPTMVDAVREKGIVGGLQSALTFDGLVNSENKITNAIGGLLPGMVNIGGKYVQDLANEKVIEGTGKLLDKVGLTKLSKSGNPLVSKLGSYVGSSLGGAVQSSLFGAAQNLLWGKPDEGEAAKSREEVMASAMVNSVVTGRKWACPGAAKETTAAPEASAANSTDTLIPNTAELANLLPTAQQLVGVELDALDAIDLDVDPAGIVTDAVEAVAGGSVAELTEEESVTRVVRRRTARGKWVTRTVEVKNKAVEAAVTVAEKAQAAATTVVPDAPTVAAAEAAAGAEVPAPPSLLDKAASVVGSVAGAVGGAVSGIAGAVEGAVSGIAGAVGGVASGVTSAVGGLFNQGTGTTEATADVVEPQVPPTP